MKITDKSGRIHSLESFGTLEGPGIRYVVFLQGCLARCLYCQNPDTWDIKGGELMSAKQVFIKIEKCLPYICSSGGGVTVSGGEPLLQMDFLIELFRLCKKASVRTAVDTSCFYDNGKNDKKLRYLVNLTDLFIIDIKAADEKLHKKLTSRDLKEALSFIYMLEKAKRPYWLRYVLAPRLNDLDKYLKPLKDVLKPLKYCKKFEFLPYHTLGRHKWGLLGLKYPLEKIPPAGQKDIKRAQKFKEFV